MAPKRSEKDFLAFILATQTDDSLVRDFFSKDTAEDLYKFFQQKKFTEIKKRPDCEDILKARKSLEGVRIPSIGEIPLHGQDPCPGPRKGY